MQINTTTKGAAKLKLQKRERDLLTGCKALCGEIARFGMGLMSEHADSVHDGLIELMESIEKQPCAGEKESAPEPAAK